MPTARTADEAVALALSFAGQTENPAGSNRFPMPSGMTLWATIGLPAYDRNAPGGLGQPYCGGGAWYCVGAEAAGVPASVFASTPAAMNAYRSMGRLVTKAQKGDVAWMNFSGGRTPEHVEIIVAVNVDGSLITVGWNTSSGDTGSQSNGGGVFRRIRPFRFVVGYGRPDYSKELRPMHDPALALEPIVADLACPTGGAWLLAASGAVYAFGGAPYLGAANGKDYFAGRKAVGLNLVDGKYQIVDSLGSLYGPGF